VGLEDEAERMRKFGELVGLAFQIKDDIFDYGTPDKIGKPTGNDIRERKMTLPLIYTLNKVDEKTRKELINIVKRHNEKPKQIKRAMEIVIREGGINYAHKKMMELKDEAIALISDLPDSPSKMSLIGLVEYTALREK